jgi:hypothetical protein
MYLSSSTLEWLEQHQLQLQAQNFARDLSAHLGKLASAMGDFVERGVRGNLASDESLPLLGYCIEALNSMTQTLTVKVRESLLPQVAGDSREIINLQLNALDLLTDRTEDILESWRLSLDPTQSALLRTRMEEVDPNKESIPDWRKALELISD